MANRFPTDYADKGSADSTDKVWSSDWSTNFNITVDEIWDEVFTDRDTDNLSEWTTNKYASTTNVDAAWATMNTDTSLVWNGYFLDEDAMTSDDATKVPSQQSVKKYVDDSISAYSPPSATESSEWTVEIATDAEVVTWTDTTRSITPKTLKDNYDLIMPWTTTTYFDSSGVDSSTTPTTWVTVKSYTATKDSILWASYRVWTWVWSTWDSRILVDGLAYVEWSNWSSESNTFTWRVFAWKWEDIDFQLYFTWWTQIDMDNTTLKWHK